MYNQDLEPGARRCWSRVHTHRLTSARSPDRAHPSEVGPDEHATVALAPFRGRRPFAILASHFRHQPVPPFRAHRRKSALAVVTRP